MPQEADEREAVRGVAVQSLKNELTIAIQILRGVKQARETVAAELQAVDSARSAFRHAVEALDRMPQLSPEDMDSVERLMDGFRMALSELD
jgi:hypothetical protein